MALDAQVLLSILSHESSAGDISRTLRVTPASYSLVLSDGTGANQAQVAWSDSRTLAEDGAFDDLDLTLLADDRGTVSFTAIKVIYIRLASGSLGIGTDASTNLPANAWQYAPLQQSTGVPIFYPLVSGSCFFISTSSAGGIPVSSGNKILRLTARLDPAAYEILLIGEGTIT